MNREPRRMEEPLLPGLTAVAAESFERIKRLWKEANVVEDPLVVQLARAGWTLPIAAPMGFVGPLFASIGPDAFDDFFLDFYLEKRKRHFRAMKERLLGSPRLARWHQLLDESFWAEKNGRVKVAVPAVLIVLEGFVADVAAPNLRVTRIAQLLEAEVNRFEDYRLEWQLLRSVWAYLDKLFLYQPFDGGEPKRLNRHWVLHGRASPEWGILELVQILNALQSFDLVAEHWQ